MLKINFSKLSKDIYSLLEDIGRLADELELEVWLVGGMVRDLWLKQSSLDVDIVVEGKGIAFARALKEKLGGKLLAHRHFGTATLTLESGLQIDVATARRETYARPGALPDVIPSQISDDLFRRDFTINAVSASLNAMTFGEIQDDFDGLDDIKHKLIRIMHYRSFIDDPTRVLRAVRYEKRFEFKMEKRTLAAIKVACEEDVFTNITPVRYWNELKQILEEHDPSAVLGRLCSLEGMRYFRFDKKERQLLKKIVKVQTMSRYPVWVPRFAGLMSFLDEDRRNQIFKLFQISRQDRKEVEDFVHFLSVPDLLVEFEKSAVGFSRIKRKKVL